MMNEEALLLLQYLKELRALNEGDYHCPNEIKAVIEALNEELGII